MPEIQDNYEKSVPEYEFGKEFNKLSKARDFWADMILNNKKEADPFQLKSYKEKVNKYSKQLMNISEMNKGKKDATQTKYYEELKNKTVEKQIVDKRFDNLNNFLKKKSFYGGDSNQRFQSKWIYASWNWIWAEWVGYGLLNVDDKSFKNYRYEIHKKENWSYLLVLTTDPGSNIQTKTEITLDSDQLDKQLDTMVSKIQNIKNENENKEKSKKQQDAKKAEAARRIMDLAQIDQKIDQAYADA